MTLKLDSFDRVVPLHEDNLNLANSLMSSMLLVHNGKHEVGLQDAAHEHFHCSQLNDSFALYLQYVHQYVYEELETAIVEVHTAWFVV